MSYRAGHCCSCGVQTWITDALGRLVHPLNHLREGYLVFKTELGETFLKIPTCAQCESALEGDKLKTVLKNLLDSGEAQKFSGLEPDRYQGFKQHWAAKKIDVKVVWEKAPSVEAN